MVNLAESLCALAETVSKDRPTCSCLLITAVMKLISRTDDISDYTQSFLERYSNSIHLDLQQRCYETLQLLTILDKNDKNDTLPVNASCEDIEVHSTTVYV